MLRPFPFILLFVSVLAAAGCADDTVVQTGGVEVRTDPTVDFSEFASFSVVTKDLVETPADLPELGEEQEAFNNFVNGLIIEAMQAPPVCLDFIEPDETSAENSPDLWAANGVGQSTGGGYVYQCCGGWWWGYWGWYWDPCAVWCPTYVEWDTGNLLIPVGLPLVDGEDPRAVFAGIASSIVGTGLDAQTKARQAVEAIFSQWPIQRSECP
jgi:hypothetical protein